MALFLITFAGAPADAQPENAAGDGFVLLNFPSEEDIGLGQWKDWANPATSQPYALEGQPFKLMYAIDSEFMADEPAEVREAATTAVLNALESWSSAMNGFITFVPAPWSAVENRDEFEHSFFRGPGVAEWIADWRCDCFPSDCPFNDCYDFIDHGVFPGWGADIDVFSRPAGFTLTSNGFNYLMEECNLGFAVVHFQADMIWSADVYLNSDFDWTADAALAMNTAPPQGVRFGSGRVDGGVGETAGRSVDMHDRGGALGPCGVPDGTVFDIETVVLHEVGHVLGLDHPDQAAGNGAAVLQPYTFDFVAPGNSTPTAVMHSLYTGVKRELTNDEIGGVTFLYRSNPFVPGDVDADTLLTLSDAAYALELIDSDLPGTPFEVNQLDFFDRTGRVEIDEVVQVLLWVFDPTSNPPGQLPGASVSLPDANPEPVLISIMGEAKPFDIGSGGSVDVEFRISNPSGIPVKAWEFSVSYDQALFSNPRVADGELLANGWLLDPGADDGAVQVAKLTTFGGDTSTEGMVATVTFDIDLQNAIDAGQAQFTIDDLYIVVDTPFLHSFARVPMLDYEQVVTASPKVIVSRLDADGNGHLDIEDLYTAHLLGIDVDRDGDHDRDDIIRIRDALREQMTAELEASQP